jgi:hypothetical protein
MTDLIVRPDQQVSVMSNDEIDRTYRIAKALHMSGMFKDVQKAEQAFAKMLLGRDLGLSPTQALTSIHVVEGKPELSANLQAALMRQYRSPEGDRYDFRVHQLDPEGCVLRFLRVTRDGQVTDLGVSEFSIKDAQAAGLAARDTWKKYARNMLFSRALSNGVAWFTPEVTYGVRVYAEGELSGHDPDGPQELPAVDDEQPAVATDIPWDEGYVPPDAVEVAQ